MRDCCSLADYKWLKLDDYHRIILEKELDFWHNAYLPVKGAVVDIGAGNGETALFYLLHGATEVIAIEPKAALLRENFGNDPRVVIIESPANCVKVDGEGCEDGMTVIAEVHFPFKVEELRQAEYSEEKVFRIIPIRGLKFIMNVLAFGFALLQRYRKLRKKK
jgi:predicted RNA methylase